MITSLTLAAIHQALTGSVGPWIHAALVAATMAAPLVGFVLALLIVGTPSRTGRAARAVGVGAAGTVVLLTLTRLLEGLSSGWGGGPLGWLDGLGSAVVGDWLPREALLLVAIPHALLIVPVVVAAAVAIRFIKPAPYRVPLGPGAAVVCLAAALLVAVGAYHAYGIRHGVNILLDVVAVGPMTLVAMGIHALSSQENEEESQKSSNDSEDEEVAGSAIQGWRAAGMVSTSRPLYEVAATVDDQPIDAIIQGAWWTATGLGGASGPPPAALTAILGELDQPGQGWLVGDLPDDTDRALTTALLLVGLRDRGLTAIVVCADPVARRDALAGAVRDSGSWSVGTLAAGPEELADALAGGRASGGGFPAAILLTPEQLSADGLGTLGRGEHGRAWLAGLGLVVLPRVDRGGPLQTTHRMFALRRLWLLLTGAGAQCSMVATGFDGDGTRRLLERAMPMYDVHRVPLQPRATAAIRVWSGAPGVVNGAPATWVPEATRAAAQHRRAVGVMDPLGRVQRKDVAVWGDDIDLCRDVAFRGAASVAMLNDAWLVAAYRALSHQLPGKEAVHHALWAVHDDPVTRFLLRDSNLKQLHDRGRLDPPQPVVSDDNPHLAAAHLRAALADAEQDIEGLIAVFGRPLVDAVVTHTVPAVRPRPGARDGSMYRTRVVPQSSTRTRIPSNSVTDQTYRVVAKHSGVEVAVVDKSVAATRFPPRWLFAVGPDRYEVPLHSLDDKRGVIEVESVDADRAPNHPLLAIQLTDPAVHAALTRFSKGRVGFTLSSFDVLVTETIDGVCDEQGTTVRYDPVTSRYRSRARCVGFEAASQTTLLHLAGSLKIALNAHLLASEGAVQVVVLPSGFPEHTAGVALVDRFVGGMGVAEALTEHVVADALSWVYAILFGCPCTDGCLKCSPADVVRNGPVKQDVLRLLGA